ncbi:MAG: response regulator [Planctomycetota bacterium]|nr:MAG: response regulator [Planctomycetota bacterium]
MAETPFSDENKEETGRVAAGFLERFVKVIKHVQLYPPEHPYIKQGIEDTMKSLGEIFVSQPEFNLGVSEQTVLFNEKPIDAGTQVIKELTKLLERINLTSLSFKSRLTAQELLEFAKMMGMKPDIIKEAGGPEDYLSKRVENISVNTFEFRKMRTGTIDLAGEDKGLLTDELEQKVLTKFLTERLLEKAHGSKAGMPVPDGDTREQARSAGVELDAKTADPQDVASSIMTAVKERLEKQGTKGEGATRAATLETLDKIARMFTHESTAWTSSKDLLIKVILMLEPDLQNTLTGGKTGAESADLDSVVDDISRKARTDILIKEMVTGRIEGQKLKDVINSLTKNKEDRKALIELLRETVERKDFPGSDREAILYTLESIGETGAPRPAPERKAPPVRTRITEKKPPSRLVYVADRDGEIREQIAEKLKKTDIEVKTTESGEELLQWITVRKPHSIIMDIKLAGLHGLELLEKLNRKGLDRIPLTVYTKMQKPEHEFAVQKYRKLDWVRKDVPVEELVVHVTSFRETQTIWLYATDPKRSGSISEHLTKQGDVTINEFTSLFKLTHNLALEAPDAICLSVQDSSENIIGFISFVREKYDFDKVQLFIVDADRTQTSFRPLLKFKDVRFVPGMLRTHEIAGRILEILAR